MPFFFFFKVILTLQHWAQMDTGTCALTSAVIVLGTCLVCTSDEAVRWGPCGLPTVQHLPTVAWGAGSRSCRRGHHRRKIDHRRRGEKWICLAREREGEGIACTQGKLSLLLLSPRLGRIQVNPGRAHNAVGGTVGQSVTLSICHPAAEPSWAAAPPALAAALSQVSGTATNELQWLVTACIS